MRTHPVAVLALAVVALAACGSGGEQEAAAATTPPTPPPTRATTTTEAPAPASALTGRPVEEEVTERPVVAVKYDNRHGKSTPQVGINAADLVYEITVEGTVTRFLALFQSRDAGPVGPVRSARGSEIGLLEELHRPVFAWHGANAVLARAVRGAAIVPRSIDDVPGLYYRDAGRPAPYDSFAVGTEELRATAPEDATGPPEPLLTFAEGDAPAAPPSPTATPATTVHVVFPVAFARGGGPGGVPVRFHWDGEQWRRSQGGRPHVDADGEQIAVENVIVRFTDPADSGTRDVRGSLVPTAVVTGEGEAWVFSRGTVTVGTWHKPDAETRTTYRDEHGEEILLAPGQTWVALPYGPGSSYE